jgi:hypothetical protein
MGDKKSALRPARHGTLAPGRFRTMRGFLRVAAVVISPTALGWLMSFQTASQNYYNDLESKSQFATLCNHNNVHSIPLDARAAVWQLFQAHPFGTVPSPYAGGLPSSMPSYCTL